VRALHPAPHPDPSTQLILAESAGECYIRAPAMVPWQAAGAARRDALSGPAAQFGLRAGRAGRLMARNSHATAEASRAAYSAERWISPGLFARSTWYIR